MGLFDEEYANIKENYVKVVDVLEKLYECSDQGWYEVLHFLKNSKIHLLKTYISTSDIPPRVFSSDDVLIEHPYAESFREGTLKDALLAFISNNCEYLDGEHLENKIITETELIKKFKPYVWLKTDVESLEDFKKLNLIECLAASRPVKNIKENVELINRNSEKNNKYRELIFCIQHFTERFNQSLVSIAKILKQTKFYKCCNAYVRIGNNEFVQLNKVDSEKSILFVLDFLDDSRFNSIELDLDTDYYHLMHILVDEDDLLYFEPLKDLIVDIKIGHNIYENMRYGDIKLNKLPLVEEYHHQQAEIFFNTHSEMLKNTTVQPYEVNMTSHPALDINNPNHAPELLLAVRAWESKYIEDKYRNKSHSQSIELFLKGEGYTETRLTQRISAITNPNKTK